MHSGSVAAMRAREARDGFCFWAAELCAGADPIGFCGVQRVPFETRITPAVEDAPTSSTSSHPARAAT